MLSVEVSADGVVEGSGDCVIVAGPGKGQEIGMVVDANAADDEIDGSVVMDAVAEDAVALEGSIEDGAMLLFWTVELPAQNNSPEAIIEVTAALSPDE